MHFTQMSNKSLIDSGRAIPIVVVPKANRAFRIDADFRMGLNSQLESKFLQVINTPFGLFQYQRLPFAVSSASAIFQRFIESLLTGIPNCATFLDHIIISRSSLSSHLETVEVLNILMSNGLVPRSKKCEWFKGKITYLGQILSKSGVSPDPDKSGLADSTLLEKSDTYLPVLLSTDASLQGSMRYNQLEKEGLVVVFGLKKFNQYLYGWKFEIITETHLPVLAAQRIQRWNMLLMMYKYTLVFRPTIKHYNVYALSRLPKGLDHDFDEQYSDYINMIDMLDQHMNFQTIQKATICDIEIRKKIDSDIEQMVKSCNPCSEEASILMASEFRRANPCLFLFSISVCRDNERYQYKQHSSSIEAHIRDQRLPRNISVRQWSTIHTSELNISAFKQTFVTYSLLPIVQSPTR
ncbi:hypothetical protein RF11_05567 [Thelohanellus kitauei]|uniref:Uncharacterized protein n=1 Tax=Thelohanellus kitauei TaxID=669202 RepID=A0A0C2JM93_THEKT|nr:hypothetical protein RF11_05567 [Thelohanellus kitauei]